MKKPIKHILPVIITAILVAGSLSAQHPGAICGWTIALNEEESESTGNSETQCFNVEEVLESCTPVYIRLNVHFFTDTDCNGDIQITQKSQYAAYGIAEKMISDANHVLANNQIQWQSPNAVQVCNPIRYVLSGVYIHCLSDAVGGVNTASLHFNWGVHKDTEINVYIVNFPGAATGIGFPTYASIDWIETGNLNHEICHVFGLIHTFDPTENCSDTPRVLYDWDKNCDGDASDSGEQLLQCWSYIDSGKIPGEPGFSDINNNGTHDCDETVCAVSPCCDWAFIDNNIMSYNAYKTSYTKCQLSKMLTDLAVHDCDYIEKIGGCPPPKAFISQTPKDILNTEYCSECIILQASFNEVQHLLEIYETSNGLLAYSAGWQNGPAQNFCFKTGRSNTGYPLKPNTEYRVMLTVKNECGEIDDTEYVFTTPGPKCTIDGIHYNPKVRLSLYPNPVSNILQAHFSMDSDEMFKIEVVDNLTGCRTVLQQNYYAVSGENQVDISVANLRVGSYTLSFVGEYNLYQSHFLKF